MRNAGNNWVRFRVLMIGVVFSAVMVVICAKAVYLQIYRGPWLSQLASEQYEAPIKFAGKRGVIYDRQFSELAVSIEVTSVAAYPRRMDNPDRSAAALGKVLRINPRELKKKLRTDKAFVWVKRQATPREVEQIKKLDLKGVGFIPEYNRFYPNKTLAAQVIGFTGIDGEGLEGIEYAYDRHLKGEEQETIYLRDALGHRYVPAGESVGDFSGSNLILTIDRNIQYIAEKALEEAVTTHAAASGIAIVMEPKTGAVLALAHYPFFNPNDFRRFSKFERRNRAITDPFEPGSTLKIFSAAGAVESGGTSPNTIFFCENGSYRIGRKVIHDMTAHGWLSLQQIIKYSSNIGAIKVGEMVGAARLHKTLADFGFGVKTDIDCPGESPGSLSDHRQWTPMDAGAIAFGHGVAVSPIQMITAVSVIANGGFLMKPRLVSAVVDEEKRVLRRFEPRQVRRVVSGATAAAVAGMMKTVVTEGGTGVRAALDGYSACGKTGTAQKLDPAGTYSNDEYIASFVGFAPFRDPAISVLVIVDNPRKQYYGGVAAAPAFRRIAQETLHYLNIPPDGDGNQLALSRPTEDRS
jgi:cell division protein FtsI (penicillin-binding protein 3)